MRDFTLKMYREYLEAIRNQYQKIVRFDEYMSSNEKFDSFCLIRHDVDRKANNALKMAKIEAEFGIVSTYYFRTKSHVFQKDIILQIHNLGHEIGYHYENLSDAKGNLTEALKDFEIQLQKLRDLVPVHTISMHGRPLSKFDNREMWKENDSLKMLKEKFNLLGEIYLHVDYHDIAYLSDTGRNWLQSKSNKRDKVNSSINIGFENGSQLLHALKNSPPAKLVFQIHPERWSDGMVDYSIQYCKDQAANLVKKVI